MMRNIEIRIVETPRGTRYIYGPQTYRTLGEAEAAKTAHEAEYDRHIAGYHEQYERVNAETIAAMLAEQPGLDPATITPEMRAAFVRRRGYHNVLAAAGGDKKRAAVLYRGTDGHEEC